MALILCKPLLCKTWVTLVNVDLLPSSLNRRASNFSIHSSASQLMTPQTNESQSDYQYDQEAMHLFDHRPEFFFEGQPKPISPVPSTLIKEELTQPMDNLHLNEDEDDDEPLEPSMCGWGNCSLEFANVEQLVKHISDDHIGSGKTCYTCEWRGCSRGQKPFSKRHKIQNHVRIHTGERPFACTVPGCGKKFSRQDGLNTHIKVNCFYIDPL